MNVVKHTGLGEADRTPAPTYGVTDWLRKPPVQANGLPWSGQQPPELLDLPFFLITRTDAVRYLARVSASRLLLRGGLWLRAAIPHCFFQFSVL